MTVVQINRAVNLFLKLDLIREVETANLWNGIYNKLATEYVEEQRAKAKEYEKAKTKDKIK